MLDEYTIVRKDQIPSPCERLHSGRLPVILCVLIFLSWCYFGTFASQVYMEMRDHDLDMRAAITDEAMLDILKEIDVFFDGFTEHTLDPFAAKLKTTVPNLRRIADLEWAVMTPEIERWMALRQHMRTVE